MALMDTLTDTLDAQDLVKWTKAEVSAGLDVTFASGNMSIRLRNGYPTYTSATTYDLTSSQAYVELVSHPGANATGSAEVLLVTQTSDNLNGYGFVVAGNPLTLLALYKVGSASWTTHASTVTYNSTTHRWLRIRHSAGTIFWDTAPDGVTWTNRYSRAASAFSHTAMVARLQAGDWNADSLVAAAFNNFNTTGASTDTITVDKANLTLTPRTILETELVGITRAQPLLTGSTVLETELVGITRAQPLLTGGSVTLADAEITPVTQASLTLTPRTVLETELVGITRAAPALTGGTVTITDVDAVTVTQASLTLTGQTVTINDPASETITVDSRSLTLSGGDVAATDTMPIGGPMAGGGGGGPASDAAYHARRQYEQDKRDRERRLWKGEPARAVPDKAEESPQVAAEVKKTLPPEEFIDPIQALLDMIAAPAPTLLLTARPSRVFDPEDDVAVLLLTDL